MMHRFWILVVVACCFVLKAPGSHAQNIYCGKRECYDILEVDRSATLREIKKNYRRLSLLHHPDKNIGNATSKELFQAIAASYEILTDDEKRKSYNYYLDHPNDFAYNMGQYYRHVYAPKSDLRVVIFVVIAIFSVIQWISAQQKYNDALNYFRNSDKLRLMALQVQAERKAEKKGSRPSSGKNKKKAKAQEKEELQEIIEELMSTIEISGGNAKPEIKNLLIVRVFMLPLTAVQYAKWRFSWFYRHTLNDMPYDKDEQQYLICKALGISEEAFLSNEFDDKREEMFRRQIWIPENLEQYREDEEEEFKRKNPEKFKRMMRNKKKKGDFGATSELEEPEF